MIYNCLYTDAGNYKQHFRAYIAAYKEPGDEMWMEDANITEQEFREYMGWPKYDHLLDHNILEIVGLSEDQTTEADITLYNKTN